MNFALLVLGIGIGGRSTCAVFDSDRPAHWHTVTVRDNYYVSYLYKKDPLSIILGRKEMAMIVRAYSTVPGHGKDVEWDKHAKEWALFLGGPPTHPKLLRSFVRVQPLD